MMRVGGKVDTVTVHRGQRGGGACVLEFASGAMGNFHMSSGGSGQQPLDAQPLERYSFSGDGCSVTIDNNHTVTVQFELVDATSGDQIPAEAPTDITSYSSSAKAVSEGPATCPTVYLMWTCPGGWGDSVRVSISTSGQYTSGLGGENSYSIVVAEIELDDVM